MKIASLYKLYCKNYLVDIDTRQIRKNTLYFALKGENFNGNTFAHEALEKGALYSIVDEKEYVTSENIILVDNVLKTLQELAVYHREKLNIPVIGLTGSNGKTTTKELINAVLSTAFTVTATQGNLNNHIGVPLTLLSMTPKTTIGIVEMGANHQKEIEFLCTIARPNFGYITNFGKAHLEGFGSVEGVIKGKSELYAFLKENQGTAFINPKDTIQLEKTTEINRVLFTDIQLLTTHPFINLTYKNQQIKSHLMGAYNVSNIMAAITIGTYFNVTSDKIKNGIENYTPANNRSQILKTANNTIILDAYNANPSSMVAALENFKTISDINKTIILGDMFELGEKSMVEHQTIVDIANDLENVTCYFVGNHFYSTTTSSKKFKAYSDLESFLIKNPLTNNSILIKGSRGMALERLLKVIN